MARGPVTTTQKSSAGDNADAGDFNTTGTVDSSSGLDDVVAALVRKVVRQELAHFFDSAMRPALERLSAAEKSKPSDAFFSAEEAAQRAGVTAATIREWVRTGKLAGYRAGRLVRIKVSELDLFLASGGAANVVDLDAEARRILAGVRRR